MVILGVNLNKDEKKPVYIYTASYNFTKNLKKGITIKMSTFNFFVIYGEIKKKIVGIFSVFKIVHLKATC